MDTSRDLVVIGAGPAGMAAAARAARAGLSVLLLDEQPRAGGQIYRDVARALPLRGGILGADYAEGLALAEAVAHPAITHLGGAVVWQIEEGRRVAFSRDGRGGVAEGRHVLIATGALERPMPLPGWTLPGVMTAGAAQILLKQSGMVAERAVLAGSGPLLYLLAVQMLRAGSPPLALVETQTPGDMARALPQLPRALAGWPTLRKGLAMLRALGRAGVPRYRAARDLAIEGAARAEALVFESGGARRRIACETVLLHHGVVPNTQAARSLGLPHRWDEGQRAFRPVADGWGRTAMPSVFVAGDGAGISGARAAALAGELAALEIAREQGVLSRGDRDLEARGLRARLWLERAPRAFLERAYPPWPGALAPADGTVVCRCEEVTAGEIRGLARLGCIGPNQAKTFSRAGMGPCQGRFCGLTVTEILAAANGRSQEETGHYRIRPPLKPVTLGEIAALRADREETEDA